MRPCEVLMQAFGPYIKENRIDFTKLCEQGIFLITGATGGGKTTVLDAMCFALYGRATGGLRTWGDMRNISAPDDLPTVVDFSFCLGEEKYRFCRSMRIHYVRGSGRREMREEHACYCMKNGEWELLIAGAEARVREQAIELLGLDCDQFSKVIMLPQGEFRSLLLASSNEKARIFQKLFDTGKWEKIAVIVQRKAAELKKQADVLFVTGETILKRHSVEKKEELEALLAQSLLKAEQVNKALSQAQREEEEKNQEFTKASGLFERFQELDAWNKRAQALRLERGAILKRRKELLRIRQLKRLFPYFKAQKEWKDKLEEKAKEISSLQLQIKKASDDLIWETKKWEQTQQTVKAEDGLSAQIAVYEQSMQTLEQVSELVNAIGEQQAKLDALKKEQSALEEKKGLAEANSKKGEEYIEDIRQAIAAIPGLLLNQQRLTKLLEQFESLDKQTKQLELQSKLIASLEQDCENQLVASEAIGALLKAAKLEEQRDMSGALAAQLIEGEPCPVCGSVHHPHPALLAKGISPQRQVGALEKRYQEDLQALARLQGELHKEKQDYSSRRQDRENLQSLCEQQGIGWEQAKSQAEDTAQKLMLARKKESKLEQARTRLLQRKAEMQQAERALVKQKEFIAAQESTLKETQARLEMLQKTLPQGIEDANKALARRRQLQNSLLKLRKERESAQESLQAAKERLVKLQARETETRREQSEAQKKWAEAERLYETAVKEADGLPRESITAADMQAAAATSEKELETIEQELTEFDRKQKNCEEQIVALQRKLEREKRPELERLEREKAGCREKSQALSEKSGELSQQCREMEQSLTQLTELAKQGGAVQKEYAATSRLAQLLNGNNVSKVPIRMFVLGIMLDDILSSANRYFSTFSGGRYCLNRIEDRVAARGYNGLELEVFDAYCGGSRAINTLSGGETFLASLSLAFGLSDVVQSGAGGVRLDSIFIDEGFGTLDQETLDTAMKAIAEIQKLGRTVGIISHVSQLRALIPARIEVISQPGGGSAVRVRAE